MKPISNKILLAVVTLVFLAIVSCHKKHDTTPSPVTGVSASVSGKSYSASTQIKIPNDSALFAASSTYNPVLPSGGGFFSFTTSTTVPDTIGTSVINVPVYQYYMLQGNTISPGDTALFGFVITSASAINTGKYSSTIVSSTSPAYALGVYSDEVGLFDDSTSTGNVTITSINTTNLTISGTYSFVITGSKGSIPSTVSITNGQFTNIPYQKF